MAFWLRVSKEFVRKAEREGILTFLGVAAESYVRELLREAVGKEVVVWDDDRGTFLAGTSDALRMRIKGVLSVEETRRLLKGAKNADVIAEDEGFFWLIEVKMTSKPITKEVVEKLLRTIQGVGGGLGRVKGLIIQLGAGEVTLPAATLASSRGITILTREGVRMVAKKLGFPLP